MNKKFYSYILLASFAFMSLFLASCNDDEEPEEENLPEIITDVTLTFTPEGGGTAVTATATDPDGDGVADLAVSGPVNLAANTTYTLAITIFNSIANENVTEEIEEEDDEHQFFFSFTDGAFSSPMGNGNVDNRDDAVNYEDEDGGGLPLGLETMWTTGDAASGSFRVILKHQPDIKSSTSTSNDGESDFDISWTLNIQ
ncbi:MAG: hypothetical protein AAFQ94_18330 [Bacteroidota bacterium]